MDVSAICEGLSIISETLIGRSPCRHLQSVSQVKKTEDKEEEKTEEKTEEKKEDYKEEYEEDYG